MRRFTYHHVDVFTDTAFGGNPLAVIPAADGLSGAEMQRIAREFNFSESTFVLPAPDADHAAQVRIFTPTREVPFAGHPNIGTAWVLAQLGRFGDLAGGIDTRFAEQAGTVDIHVATEGGTLDVTLRAPEPLSIGAPLAIAPLAAALGLDEAAISTVNHAPCEASVGLPFTVIELTSEAALAAVVVNAQALQEATALGVNPDLYCYWRDGQHIAARMFAPFDGVPEDPATGSATCAAAGLLASLADASGELKWSFVQGVDMGRPSRLEARTHRDGDKVTDIWLSGRCVPFAVGELTLP